MLNRCCHAAITCEEREKEYFLDLVTRCAAIADDNIRGDSYQGDVQEEKAHGQGQSRGRNRYEGVFRQGMKHGRGVYTWADGIRYEGEFAEDKAVALGKLGTMRKTSDGWYQEAEEVEDLEKALKLLDAQFKVTPKHAPSFVLWGILLAQQGDIEALSEFVLRKYPS